MHSIIKAFLIFDSEGNNYYYKQLKPFVSEAVGDRILDDQHLIAGLLSAINVFTQSIFSEEIRQVSLASHYITFYRRKVDWAGDEVDVYFAIIGQRTLFASRVDYVAINDVCFRIYDRFLTLDVVRERLTHVLPIRDSLFDEFVVQTLAMIPLIAG